jgi:hypothetical protein
MRPDISSVARAQLHDAATMGRPAHHPVGDAERVHNIEGEQRDVRRLEHVAASVEHEVRGLARLRHRRRLLPEPLQFVVIELQT